MKLSFAVSRERVSCPKPKLEFKSFRPFIAGIYSSHSNLEMVQKYLTGQYWYQMNIWAYDLDWTGADQSSSQPLHWISCKRMGIERLTLKIRRLVTAKTNNSDSAIGRYLALLAKYDDWLTESVNQSGQRYDQEQLNQKVAAVLKDLCSLGEPFWFASACVWFVEQHQDFGTLLIPGPGFNSSPDNPPQLHVITEFAASSAFIQLRRQNRQIGVLTVRGADDGPRPTPHDELFLRSLGTLIVNRFIECEKQSQVDAISEMDQLFSCDSLEEAWPQAADVMSKYLSADACMVIFRPDPTQLQLQIVSQVGFEPTIDRSMYQAGSGLTGKCAEVGEPILVDDVSRHREAFDAQLLLALERTHGRPIRSWMAIPIGDGASNYGVIKVVNRSGTRKWFSETEKQLGVALALRLKVVIEKILHIRRTETAREQAHLVQRQAEQVARERQDDLMIIMHQLQGPLASMLGSISYLKQMLLPAGERRFPPLGLQKRADEQLTNLEDFVNDSMALSYGVFTTFALDAGTPISFEAWHINVMEELKNLTRRLQKTNARADLTFRFHRAVNFPELNIDPQVFISVFYSLIHNAMKYADMHSEVTLECGFEGRTPALKVKSFGEPIHPSERKAIFERFGRGKVLRITGRHHSGVGLGLWVSRELMRAMGGDLTVELSPNEPRLSVFVVYVPMN